MLCQAASSSALFLVLTNLAALCSLSYLATAAQHCGPLPQEQIMAWLPETKFSIEESSRCNPCVKPALYGTAHYI